MSPKTNFEFFINTSYESPSSYLEAMERLYKDLYVREQFDFTFLNFPQECLNKIKTDNTFPTNLFHLLNAYELKFLKEGIKEKYPKVYYRIYYCFYYILIKWGNEQAAVNSIKKWIQKKWLTICFNSLSDKALRHWLESREIDPCGPIDVEENVRDILFSKEGNLNKEFKCDEEMKFYASRATDWFLKRYSWISAVNIYKKKQKRRFSVSIFTLIILNILVLFSLIGIFNINFYPDFLPSPPFLYDRHQLEFKSSPPIKEIIDGAKIGTPFYAEAILVLVMITVIFYTVIKGYKFAKLLLPRLLGTVLIGFIPLTMGQEVYTFPLRLNIWQIFAMSGILYLIALLYLTTECYITTGKKDAFMRALLITLYGLFISFFIGIFICDITSIHFIDYSRSIYATSYRGLFGVLYPQIVIFFASAALLMGIFIQVFWEEKTITEPL